MKSNIGERLRKLRGQKNQEDFARQVGINKNTLRAYEKDRNSPTIDTILGICEALAISPSWLMFGEGPMQRDGQGLADGSKRIGERIRRARGVRSEGELAAALDVSQEILKSYEQGETKPDNDFIRKLSAETGYNIDWINCGTGYPKGGDNPGASLVESGCPGCAVKEQALQKAYDDLSKANKAIVTLSAQVTQLSMALTGTDTRAAPDAEEDEGSSRSVA